MKYLTIKKHKASWKFNIIFLLIMSLTTGLLIDFFIYQVGGVDRMFATYQTVIISSVFTVIFTGSFIFSGSILRKKFTLDSIRNLGIYIAANSVVMIIAFFLAACINELIYSELEIISGDSVAFYLIFGVSVLACMIGNAIYYGRGFYFQFMESERLRYESRLAALKAQIKPHFLFNTLNSIASLIRTDPKKAETMIEDLSDLFRSSLKSSQKKQVTLKEELELVEMYLAIEKVRFGERLQYTINQKADAAEIFLPGFILQPLVENCIKHGSTNTMEPVYIHLTTRRRDQYLVIEVTDDGRGFGGNKPEELMSKGTGLYNIKERLELYYNGEASVKPEGNSVTLYIPL